MMKRARSGVLVVLLAVTGGALAGCVAPAASPGGSSTPRVYPSASAASTATPMPTTPVQDATAPDDPAAATDALAAAVAAVTAYCRPGMSKGEWMAALTPLLTAAAVVAYDTVDPATVPCKSYVGNATVRSGDDAYVFRFNVPTDVGTYEAYVTRPATSAPWLVERMAPPE